VGDKTGWQKYSKYVFITASVLCFIIGAWIAFIGNSASNPILIVVGFVFMGGGITLFIYKRRSSGETMQSASASADKTDKPTLEPNCLVISEEYINFEYVYNPPGLPQKCLNNNRHYHVLKKVREEEIHT